MPNNVAAAGSPPTVTVEVLVGVNTRSFDELNAPLISPNVASSEVRPALVEIWLAPVPNEMVCVSLPTWTVSVSLLMPASCAL